MSPLDVRVIALTDEIRTDWHHIRTNLESAESVDPSNSASEAALVALSLDHAYQAFETILVRLERALGLPERSGASWHTALLADAGLPLTGVRPAVYPPDTKLDWEALRRFRHFLRHAYGAPLDPVELRSNLEHLRRAVAATDGSVERLLASLSAGDGTDAQQE